MSSAKFTLTRNCSWPDVQPEQQRQCEDRGTDDHGVRSGYNVTAARGRIGGDALGRCPWQVVCPDIFTVFPSWPVNPRRTCCVRAHKRLDTVFRFYFCFFLPLVFPLAGARARKPHDGPRGMADAPGIFSVYFCRLCTGVARYME